MGRADGAHHEASSGPTAVAQDLRVMPVPFGMAETDGSPRRATNAEFIILSERRKPSYLFEDATLWYR